MTRADLDKKPAEVQAMFDALSNQLPNIRDGRVRPLALMRDRRSPALPDLPTTAEAGVPDAEMPGWIGLFAPAGTPPEIVKAVNAAAEKALAKPATIALLATEGNSAMGGSPERARQYILEEQAKWAKLIKDARITLE